MQHDAAKPGKFIIGLPVPAASAVLVSLVLLNHQLAGSFVDVGQPALAILVVVLSYLMVSRIRFRSFKDLRLSRRTITGFLAIAAFTVGGADRAHALGVHLRRASWRPTSGSD